MAATVAYQYPAGDFTMPAWPAPPTFSVVDDPFGSPDDSDFGDYSPTGTPATTAAEWTLTAPPTGVVIVSVTLYARVWATSNNSTTHDLTVAKIYVRPGGGSPDKKNLGSGTILGTTGAQGPNPQTYASASAWTVNPATGLAWTIADLQSLVIGVEWSDVDTGSVSPFTFLSQVYAVISCTTIAQTTERFRGMGTAVLRAVRAPFEVTEINTDAEFADIHPGDPLVIDHQLGPSPSAAGPIAFTPAIGWGKQNWARRDHICLANTLHPELFEIGLEAWDVRKFRCRLWGVFKHDLGYSDEAQGVGWLDSGGGRTFTRNQQGYVQKQALDPGSYSPVPVDFPKWDPEGFRLEGGGDLSAMLNNSFSQGAGAAFTSWTKTTTLTGAVNEDLVDFLFDASGLRRSANFTTGASVSNASLAQTSASSSAAFARVVHIAKLDAIGTSLPHWTLQRASDANYWNDSTGAWGAGVTLNTYGTLGVYAQFFSKLIPLTGTTTYTLATGYPGTAQNAAVHVGYADLRLGTRAQTAAIRSPLVTTTTSLTRITDVLLAQNNTASRWWDPVTRGGTILITLKTLFDHNDLADNESRPILYLPTSGTRFEFVYYHRTSSGVGEFRFQRFDGSTVFEAVVTVSPRPTYLSEWKLAYRWIGPDLELGLPAYTVTGFANGLSASVASVAQVIDTNTNGNICQVGAGSYDYIVKEIESFDGALEDAEILARLG